MAAGTAGDFTIYQDQFQGGFVETFTQWTEAFNAASQGAIQLVSEAHKGNYTQEAYFKNITNMVGRRDTTDVTDATPDKLEQGEFATVKLDRRIGPVDQTLDAFRKAGLAANAQSMSFLLGTQVAKAVAVGQLDDAISALVAATGADSANVEFDQGGLVTTAGLVDTLAKMGDRAQQIVAWVMHSSTYYALVKEQIAANIFEISGVNVREGAPVTLGRPVVVTDSASLTNSASPTGKIVLGLVPRAVRVMDTEARDVVQEIVTGKVNLLVRLQGEYAFNLGVRGFTWDITNGGANPTGATLATTTNWDKQVTSHKDGPGVRMITDS